MDKYDAWKHHLFVMIHFLVDPFLINIEISKTNIKIKFNFLLKFTSLFKQVLILIVTMTTLFKKDKFFVLITKTLSKIMIPVVS